MEPTEEKPIERVTVDDVRAAALQKIKRYMKAYGATPEQMIRRVGNQVLDDIDFQKDQLMDVTLTERTGTGPTGIGIQPRKATDV